MRPYEKTLQLLHRRSHHFRRGDHRMPSQLMMFSLPRLTHLGPLNPLLMACLGKRRLGKSLYGSGKICSGLGWVVCEDLKIALRLRHKALLTAYFFFYISYSQASMLLPFYNCVACFSAMRTGIYAHVSRSKISVRSALDVKDLHRILAVLMRVDSPFTALNGAISP